MQVSVMNKIVEAGAIAHGSETCHEQDLKTSSMQVNVQTNLGTVTKAPTPVTQGSPSKRQHPDRIPNNQGSNSTSTKETSNSNPSKPTMTSQATTVEAQGGGISNQQQQSHESADQSKLGPNTLIQTGMGKSRMGASNDECETSKVPGNDTSPENGGNRKNCEKVGERPSPISKGIDEPRSVEDVISSIGANSAGKDASLPVLAIVAASVREDRHHTVPTKPAPSQETKNLEAHVNINYANLNLIANAASNQISEGEGSSTLHKSPQKDAVVNDSEQTPPWQKGKSAVPLPRVERNGMAEAKIGGGEHAALDASEVCREQQTEKKSDENHCDNHMKTPFVAQLKSYEEAWNEMKAKAIKHYTNRRPRKIIDHQEKDPRNESSPKTSAEGTGTGGGIPESNMIVDDDAEKKSLKREEVDLLAKRKTLEDFKYAISRSKIQIQNDTSITGQFSFGLSNLRKVSGAAGEDAERKRKPYGFEPSTGEACRMEQYEVIKPSSPILTDNSTTTTTWDSKNYYQSWDPVARKFAPKRRLYDGDSATTASITADQHGLGQSSPYRNDGGGAGLLPLGAAAAGTRAALLSFMSAKTGLVSSAMPMARFQPNDMGMGGMAGGGYMSAGIRPGTTIELPYEQTSFNVPEKVIIQPSVRGGTHSSGRRQLESSSSATTATVTGRIVGDNDSGGKRIEQCSSASTPSRNKNRAPSREKMRINKRKKTSGRDDSSSFGETASSYKRSRNTGWESDEGTGDMAASVRRSRRRTVPNKKHDS